MTQPVIDPLYDTKNCGDVLIHLAKMIGGSIEKSFPWKNYEDILKTRVQGLFTYGEGTISYNPSVTPWYAIAKNLKVAPGYSEFNELWISLKNGGMWYNPTSNIKTENDLFSTPSSKFEFFSSDRLKTIFETPSEKDELAASEKMPLTTHGKTEEKHENLLPVENGSI